MKIYFLCFTLNYLPTYQMVVNQLIKGVLHAYLDLPTYPISLNR